MESSLKATQEQLSEQASETVLQEQNSRKSETELKTVRERGLTSEGEINDSKGALAAFCIQDTEDIKINNKSF